MYDLQTVVKDAGQEASAQQLEKIAETQQYLKEKRVHEIFHELLAKVIEDRPEKVKEGLISILKGLKEKQTYFKTTDFEAMFDSYTFFEANNQVPSAYLLQALQKIEISRTKEQLLATYPQIAKTIGKTDFVNILTEEYRKKVSRI